MQCGWGGEELHAKGPGHEAKPIVEAIGLAEREFEQKPRMGAW